jgi:hypothetical protein
MLEKLNEKDTEKIYRSLSLNKSRVLPSNMHVNHFPPAAITVSIHRQEI